MKENKETIGYYSVIPATVLYNKDLKANEKLLYAIITSLACKKGYCFASNKYLAEKLDVSYRYLTRVEMGIATPRMETLVKICKVLGVQMNDLFINHDIR